MHSNPSSSMSEQSLTQSSITDGGDRRYKKFRHVRRHHHIEELQQGLFFLISRKVMVCYGPYMVLGVMDYRVERFDGLTRALQEAGGEVELVPSYHVNEVRVWHLERRIFSCKITDLFHGGDGKLDHLCKIAGSALDQSSRRAYFNIKYRYKVDECLLNICPCHPPRHSNDSLTRVPCQKLKPPDNHQDHTELDYFDLKSIEDEDKSSHEIESVETAIQALEIKPTEMENNNKIVLNGDKSSHEIRSISNTFQELKPNEMENYNKTELTDKYKVVHPTEEHNSDELSSFNEIETAETEKLIQKLNIEFGDGDDVEEKQETDSVTEEFDSGQLNIESEESPEVDTDLN